MADSAGNALPFLKQTEEGVLLDVYVQPKASKNEPAGIHEDALKVRLTAPPVEGKANKECVRFVAKILGLPKSRVSIVQGEKSRRKTLLLQGSRMGEIDGKIRKTGAV
jgi:hypothetical protein